MTARGRGGDDLKRLRLTELDAAGRTLGTSRVAGHPDHRRAAGEAIATGKRLDLSALAWTLLDEDADQLNKAEASVVAVPPGGQGGR